LIAARNPNEIVKVLKENHKFKLKGVGPLTYHLGCDYSLSSALMGILMKNTN
jgi:hypothetical protein